ncbi:hypothetical protein EZV62_009906 [Acer yangbiense]|uniref:Mechanosensitive ion channel MscS domain-containing protein n=1 Tax=Acer yangbiense TaxID=1000413 RepID=A0A5C7I395_9ROSI|nr:hypothetical protein EZV62_009906 [Acer yangbiense]
MHGNRSFNMSVNLALVEIAKENVQVTDWIPPLVLRTVLSWPPTPPADMSNNLIDLATQLDIGGYYQRPKQGNTYTLISMMFTTKPWNCRMDILSQCPMLGKKVRSISVCTRFTASFNIRSPFPTFPIKVERKLLNGFVVTKSSVLPLKDQEAMYASEDIAADELLKQLPSDTFYSLVDVVISIPMFLRFMKLSNESGIWKDILNPILIWLGFQAARHFCNVIAPGITASKVFKQFMTRISITCLMSFVYQLKVHQFSDPVLLVAVASYITWHFLRNYIMVFHLKVGNYIKCKSVEGKVISVGLISTKVLDSEHKLVIVPNSVLEVMTISEYLYQKVTITVTLNNNDKFKIRKVVHEIEGVIQTLLRKYSDYLDNRATHISVSAVVFSTDENILEIVTGYGIREMRSRKLRDLNDEITLKLLAAVEACEDCECVKITQELG